MHGMIAIMTLLGVAAMVFWVWTLIDCLTNKRLTETQKAIWAVVIILAGWVGSLIYFFAGRVQKVYAPARTIIIHRKSIASPRLNSFLRRTISRTRKATVFRAMPGHITLVWVHLLSASEQSTQQQQAQYEEIQISYPEQSANDCRV